MKDLEKEIELLEKKVALLKELRQLELTPTRIEYVPVYPVSPAPINPWQTPWPNYPQPYIGDWPGSITVVTC